MTALALQRVLTLVGHTVVACATAVAEAMAAVPRHPRGGLGSRSGPRLHAGRTGPPLRPGGAPADDEPARVCHAAQLPLLCRGRACPQTRVLLWVTGEQLRAVFEHVVLAEYRCQYDWREHQVREIQ